MECVEVSLPEYSTVSGNRVLQYQIPNTSPFLQMMVSCSARINQCSEFNTFVVINMFTTDVGVSMCSDISYNHTLK
jgi:hypothetical protein